MILWRQKSWKKQKLLRKKLKSFKCNNLSPYIQMELFKSKKQNPKKQQRTSSQKKMMMTNSVTSKKPSRQTQRSLLQKWALLLIIRRLKWAILTTKWKFILRRWGWRVTWDRSNSSCSNLWTPSRTTLSCWRRHSVRCDLLFSFE